MANKEARIARWWKWLRRFIKANTGLTVIITAALLLEVTTGVMYYSSQNIIQHNLEHLAVRTMEALNLSIHNKLLPVEVTLDNMSWVVTDDLPEPDSLLSETRELVTHNDMVLGVSISCVPNLFPEHGRWFEAYTVRRPDGQIVSMQLGSSKHDYTQLEFYDVAIKTGKSHWSEPYLDKDGAQARVTTYSVPVRDMHNHIVAVVAADISIDWLNKIINEGKVYKHTRNYLVTQKNNLLTGDDSPLIRQILRQIKTDTQQSNYVVLKDENRKKQHVFYTPVGRETGWKLIVVLDDDEVFSKLRKIRLSLLLPLFIGALFAGFIVYRSSRNLERLRAVNAERARVTSELRVASEIQQSMLPHSRLHHDDIDICGSVVPAREVGGDLFDYYVRDEKLFFCIGDVSGKGVPAAMVMGVIHSLFRAFSAQEDNPALIMQAMNKASCQGNDSCIFVTLFLGVLHLTDGRLDYCDAGHDAPFVLNPSAEDKTLLLPCNAHLPLGVDDKVIYEAQHFHLMPDTTLFLYTDGLTEARKARKQLFGLQQTEDVLGKCVEQHLQPCEIVQRVKEEVQRFVGDAEQSDDLTMLAVRYTSDNATPHLASRSSITLKNNIREITKLSSFQKSVYGEMHLDPSLARQLRLAVEETVVNVIEYAYPPGTEGSIEVSVQTVGQDIQIEITDSGVAFDPTATEKADITLTAEEREIGGLGILLVRELMDTVHYERVEGRNILTLSKTIQQ